jgi:eukaryotic-like serine/threonine-protein kinase
MLAFGTPAISPDSGLPGVDDYEFIRELGRGGMGVVYEARQHRLNRKVAVKMLLAGAWARPDFKPRFRAEAEAAARLRHPGIVTIHEVGEIDGQPFLAMELVDGPSLADIVRSHPIPAARATRYARQVAEAIAHAHDSGVLHRDLKPANVLLDSSDQPRVTDFGLAKQLDSDVDLTRSGEIMGSPAYLSPESVTGHSAGATGDVYAIGAILYELLTARPPFVADTVAATLQLVLHSDPVPPRALNATVPSDLETICLKCLRKEPSRRYASATELAADLTRFENGEPIRARPVSGAERLALWGRRNPALACVSAALVLALGLGAFSILVQWRRAESSRREMALNLYAADVAAASVALREGNIGRAQSLLVRHGQGPEAREAGEPDLREFTYRLLREQCRSDEIVTLGHHPWIVTSVAVSPDGRWIASGSQALPSSHERTLNLWDRHRSNPPALRLPTSNTLWSVAFTADSQTLISAGIDGVQFWDPQTGNLRKDLPPLPGQEVTTAGDWMVTSPNHPFFRTAVPEPLWRLDLRTGERRRLGIRGWHPALSPDGGRLAVMNATQDLQVFDAVTETLLMTVATNQLHFHLRFSPDGQQLVTAGQSTSARIWNLATPGAPPRSFPSPHNVWDAAFSPDGETLVTTTSHQQVELWNARTGEGRGTLSGHTNEVWTVAVVPDGSAMVTGSKDRTVRVWPMEPPSGPPALPSWRYFNPLLSADGTHLLTYSQTNGHGGTTVWRIPPLSKSRSTALKPVGNLRGFPRGFAPDGAHVLFLNTATSALDWRLPGTTNVSRTTVLQSAPTNLFAAEFAIAGDARSCSCPDERGTFWRWSIPEGRLLGRWRDEELADQLRSEFLGAQRPNRILRGFAASRTGRWLAIGPFGMEGGYLIDFESGNAARLRGHHDDIAALAFHRDETLLATGSVDGTIRLWEVPGARFVAELPGHLESVEAVAFSPDGQTLASVNPGIEVTFWHLATRRELARMAHPDVGNHILFTPDGQRFLFGATPGHNDTSDDRIEIWEAP